METTFAGEETVTINTVNYSHGDFDMWKSITFSADDLRKMCGDTSVRYVMGNLPKVEYLHFIYEEYKKRMDGRQGAIFTMLEIFITNYIVDEIPIPFEEEKYHIKLSFKLEEREDLGIPKHDCMSCLCKRCDFYNNSQYILSQLNDDDDLRRQLFEADQKKRKTFFEEWERQEKEELERIQAEQAKEAAEKLERIQAEQAKEAAEKLERLLKEEEQKAERKRQAKEIAKRQEKKVSYNPPVYPPAQKPKCKGSATMISNAPAQRAWLEKWANEAWNGTDLWSSKTAVKYVEDRKKGIQTLLCSNVVLVAEITGVEGVIYAEVVEDFF